MSNESVYLLLGLVKNEIEYSLNEGERIKEEFKKTGDEYSLKYLTVLDSWISSLTKVQEYLNTTLGAKQMNAAKTLEQLILHARDYHLDRIKELRNQIPFGDPFVFIGLLTVLDSAFYYCCSDGSGYLGSGVSDMAKKHPNYANKAEGNHLYKLTRLTTGFGLKDRSNTVQLSLTHESNKHLTFVNPETKNTLIIAAEPFLNEVQEYVEALFKTASSGNTDSLLKIVKKLTDRPLLGTEPAE